MKKVEVFIFSVCALGFVMKLFKLPMHTVFILVTLLLLVLYYINCLIRKNKDIYSTLTGFVTTLWLFSLLSILKHFPFQSIVLIISVLCSVALIFLLYKKKKTSSINVIFCSAIIFITLFFRFLPAHNTYYLTNIKFNHEIEIDYFSWDKYSWFLYANGKYGEAMEANSKALAAVEKCLQNPKFGDENEYFTLIKEHQVLIGNKTWKEYPIRLKPK